MRLSFKFIDRWNNCKDCPLHVLARRHAIGSGDIPADVLFIGEAPGPIEDRLGRPFVGPAGRILKDQIVAVETLLGRPFKHYKTNVVACAPWITDLRDKWREPNAAEAKACSSRLTSLVQAVKPKTIIFVGKVSKALYKPPSGIPTLSIVHPSLILNMRVPAINTVTYHAAVHRLHEHLETIL